MRSCKIGYPIPFGGMTNIMQNPKFSTVLGLLIEASKRKPYQPTTTQAATNHRVTFNNNNNKQDKDSSHSNNDLIGKLSESLKSVFKEIF